MDIYLLWKILFIWFLFQENRTREREVIVQTTRPSASKCLLKGAIANFYIETTGGKLREAMLFHFIYLVCVPIFASFQGVKIFLQMLPSKPKCMFFGTALGKPLLKIGTMLTVH
jgi:hypothetical protein